MAERERYRYGWCDPRLAVKYRHVPYGYRIVPGDVCMRVERI
jgi:hypothetical protein